MAVLSANARNLRILFSVEELPVCLQSCPSIMSTSLSNFNASFSALAEALEIAEDAAPAVLAAQKCRSSVMWVAPETIRDSKAALVRFLGQEKALHVCRGSPTILRYSGERLSAKWQSLQSLIALRPEWHLEWQEWPQHPPSFLSAMRQSTSMHQRLRFLATSQEGQAVLSTSPKSAITWLTMPHVRFDDMCPGHQLWLLADG